VSKSNFWSSLYFKRRCFRRKQNFPFSVPNNSCTSDTSQTYPSSTPTLAHIPTPLFSPNAPQSYAAHFISLSSHDFVSYLNTSLSYGFYTSHPISLSSHAFVSYHNPTLSSLQPTQSTLSSHDICLILHNLTLSSTSNTSNLPHLSLTQNDTSSSHLSLP
jgi:hypothetical protein